MLEVFCILLSKKRGHFNHMLTSLLCHAEILKIKCQLLQNVDAYSISLFYIIFLYFIFFINIYLFILFFHRLPEI